VAVNSPKKNALRESVSVSAVASSVSHTATTLFTITSSPAAGKKPFSASDTKEEDDAVFESLNATQSDEDIAMACGKLEEEQVIMINYFLFS